MTLEEKISLIESSASKGIGLQYVFLKAMCGADTIRDWAKLSIESCISQSIDIVKSFETSDEASLEEIERAVNAGLARNPEKYKAWREYIGNPQKRSQMYSWAGQIVSQLRLSGYKVAKIK